MIDDTVYTVEICGDNNTFTVEATVEYEPLEDWLTGKVSYRTHVDKALLVHGNRRRDVTEMLTDRQREEITTEVDRRKLDDFYEYHNSINEDEFHSRKAGGF